MRAEISKVEFALPNHWRMLGFAMYGRMATAVSFNPGHWMGVEFNRRFGCLCVGPLAFSVGLVRESTDGGAE